MLYNDLAFLPISIDFPKNFNIINDFPTKFHFWNFKQLLDDTDKSKYETKTWKTDLNYEYAFVKELVNKLPFKELSSVRITKQNNSVFIKPSSIFSYSFICFGRIFSYFE